MKKKALLILSVVISTVSFAQITPSFGVSAGLSSASMRGESVDNLKSLLDFADGKISTANRTGFYAGGNISIPLDKMISIQPGLYYTQKGYELRGDISVKGAEFLSANAKAQLQSNYLDMPVLLKANLNGFQVFVGPQFSYLLNADLKTTAGVLGVNLLNRTIDATSQFNRWDMGVTGGIGLALKNGIHITASYDHGLQKVDANKNINSYNNAFKVGVGINF